MLSRTFRIITLYWTSSLTCIAGTGEPIITGKRERDILRMPRFRTYSDGSCHLRSSFGSWYDIRCLYQVRRSGGVST
jgi:hypothetical protein